MRLIAVIITCFNRKKKTLKCLKKLSNQKFFYNTELDIFLTDDNSSDQTALVVKKKYPNVNILKGSGKLYWGGGTNLAFRKAVNEKKYDYYLWLNDDTYLFNHAVEDLLKAKAILKKNKFIAVGSTLNKYNKLSYGGQKNLGSKIYPFYNDIVHPNNKYQKVNRFNGNIVLISNAAQKKIGFINKNLTHIAGDIEYGIRATNLKIPILLCPRFQGRCENDLKFNLFKDYYTGKKLIKSYYVLTKKYGGFLWILHFLSALLNSLKIFKLK